MKVSSEAKTMILKAYFYRLINKQEMKILLTEGIAILPTDWVYANEEEKFRKEQRRQLISNVFGTSFLKLEWV